MHNKRVLCGSNGAEREYSVDDCDRLQAFHALSNWTNEPCLASLERDLFGRLAHFTPKDGLFEFFLKCSDPHVQYHY